MVATRACTADREDGGACKATPLRDEPFCLWHSPNHVESVAEGRKMGGQRRRKESVLAAAFDVEGLETIAEIRRLVVVAVLDTLALDNSVNRNRTLAYLAQTAVKLVEAGDLADRIEALEEVLAGRKDKQGGKRR